MILPAKITFWSLLALVLLATFFIARSRPPRGFARFSLACLLAGLAFIPSCIGVQTVIDSWRFGTFEYNDFSQVDDFRVERFLPPAAKNITLEKYPQGHRAKYEIEESELRSYLDELWEKYGKYSVRRRDELNDGSMIFYDGFAHRFNELDWPPMKSAISFRSPVEDDGGGATYYFDVQSGVVYQSAGYW